MKYRAEIDGLRAFAVVPVILSHAGFDLFSGGFVGVDVFFAISGYLITTILIEDFENKRFSIVNFYERRARRILPALFFVTLVCIPFAWLWTVAVSTFKSETYRFLRLERPTPEELGAGTDYPPGTLHVPGWIDSEWLKQLVAEQLVTVKNKRGFARLEWQKLRERNEALVL